MAKQFGEEGFAMENDVLLPLQVVSGPGLRLLQKSCVFGIARALNLRKTESRLGEEERG